MSTRIPPIDLTSAVVGTTGTVRIPHPAVQVDELAHLRLYNESGCGLNIAFDNGHTETIPAGAWPMFDIEPEVRQFSYTVYYVLPNAPVSTVSCVYYYPYEGVPPTPALGNSPIGVTGGVSTSSVQTLSNETAVLGTKIIDIGTLTIADLLDIFNDHFLWSVQQSGVAHQVLAGNTAGNPLQLGQAGDITEVLGKLTVDQTTILTGIVTAAAANVFGAIGNLQQILGNLSVDGTSAFTGIATFTADPRITSKKIDDGSGNNLADWSAAGFFLKGNPANQAGFHYQADGVNTDIALAAISRFSGTGNATVAHGLKIAGVGVTPDIIIPVQSVAGSQTMGYSALGATNVTITTGAGLAWTAIAIKF